MSARLAKTAANLRIGLMCHLRPLPPRGEGGQLIADSSPPICFPPNRLFSLATAISATGSGIRRRQAAGRNGQAAGPVSGRWIPDCASAAPQPTCSRAPVRSAVGRRRRRVHHTCAATWSSAGLGLRGGAAIARNFRFGKVRETAARSEAAVLQRPVPESSNLGKPVRS